MDLGHPELSQAAYDTFGQISQSLFAFPVKEKMQNVSNIEA